ncbi:MAG: Ldh family oxidoreductase [Rhodobacteraceae bacterium]|nr:Ldh family oxidoreductase [Paracoccaceae bacterium]MBR9820167.1 Ldh family oxidoreductase [Paracoccaceae bacterium]
MLVSAGHLRGIVEKALLLQNVPQAGAELQADLLVEAELRGLPSHGVQRLPRLVARLRAGLADPLASGVVRETRPAVFTVDGGEGLGPVVMMRALERLAALTPVHGLTLAAIRNANHIGMLAYYAEAAAARNLIGIVLTTSEALVHPYGGTEAMLGTNPIAIGIPTGAEPYILDLATSRVSMGKIHHHALTGTPIPEDWAVDAEGRRTTDPEAAKAGAIAPFGGAKGYGLGLAVELLVAALAGSSFAPEVGGTLDATEIANKGDILILIDPAAGEGSAAGLAAYLDRLRASRPADPARPVAVPGDGMRARRAQALCEGIELPGALYDEIRALAEGQA